MFVSASLPESELDSDSEMPKSLVELFLGVLHGVDLLCLPVPKNLGSRVVREGSTVTLVSGGHAVHA